MENLLDALNQLTDEEKNQLSDKQKKAIKTLVGSKPSVPFSAATVEDCANPGGLKLDLRNIYEDDAKLRIPDSIPTPVASDFLCEHLRRIKKAWWLTNKKACRMLIDAVLTEVLLSESNDKLKGYCEVKGNWEGTELSYTGDVDYMFGSSQLPVAKVTDTFVLVVEAKKEWHDSAVPQILCEAGCLLKKRLAAGKNTPVFAVLTNGTDFRFFAIDTDGVVYASTKKMLEIGEDGTYKTSTSLTEIRRWINWFMTSIKSVSPRAPSKDLTNTMIAESLTKLRRCFGPKVPIHNKKRSRLKSGTV